MSDESTDAEKWESGTWEGARRAQLLRALQRTVRERLEALDELARTSERLSRLSGSGRPDPPEG